MFKSKKDEKVEHEEITKAPVPENKTLVGHGITIESALIKGKGNLTVDGEIIGEISIDGNVVIGGGGIVKGNIHANHILLSGNVTGNIDSKSSVHLTEKAKLTGDITAAGLVIDEGAVFSGKCNMTLDNSQKNNLTYDNKENNSIIEEEEKEEERDPNLSFDK